MQNKLIQIAKLVVAAGLIWWLVQTKKITAAPFIELWATPWLTFFAFAVVLATIVINNYRWLLLLRGQGIRSSSKQTVPLTFIGLFFNLAMPGAVGGDLIKAYYIAQEQPGTKLRAATSVLMDRVVGLYALALIVLAAIVTHVNIIMGSPQLKVLAVFNIALAFGFSIFFLLGFSETIREHDWTNSFLEKFPGGKFIERIYDAVHDYKNGKRQFGLGILLSILVQSMNIFLFFVIAKTLHFEISMGALFFVIPLGLMATAVPVSPGGLGVGQAVFFTLFAWFGLKGELGATLITISQVIQAVLSLIGAVFYFTRKDRIAQATAEAS
jgi:glycosyltransferase 2 family protein